MKTTTKKRKARTQAGPLQAPQSLPDSRVIPRWAYVLAVALLLAAVPVGAFLLGKERAESGGSGPDTAAGGLPATPDYHSLLVAPGDPEHVLLGTHAGIYESLDGGRNWEKVALDGQDAMNLARSESRGTVWTAGHNVFAKSDDGGETWTDVRPAGLPSLDIHGFAVDPRDGTLWAAVAGEGLFRSRDDGRSFALVSKDVGGAVMALAVTPDGRLLAGDMEKGLLASDDDGRTWRTVAREPVMGVSVNPDDRDLVVAAGRGILVSTDAGETWDERLRLDAGGGPVAWSESDPKQGYVIGFDRTLYETNDGGTTWHAVT